MGQTLTHGVYLPDEGERNCYNGLASNWSILDGAVGTVAAHTAALAGKAPAVHTHNKSDITDFPVYGTTAGTICEGNDSRLSDARTPVTHTHVTADVTDLLSGDHTWTGTNSFTAANINIKSSNFSLGDTVSSNQVKRFQWYDASNNRYACIAVNYATDKSVWVDMPLRTKNTEGTSFVDKGIRFQVKPDNTSALLPVNNSATDLGTSTNKWATLNGVNPGALSLPDFDNADPIDFSQWDVTGAVVSSNYYTPAVNGWLNISIWDRATNSIFVYRSGKERVGVFGNGSMASDGRLALLMPVKANTTYIIIIKASANSDIYAANFFPCLGNV